MLYIKTCFLSLNNLDYLIILLTFIGVLSGYRDGLILSLFSIIGVAFTIFFYSTFSELASEYLKPWVENKKMLPYLTAIAMFTILTLISILANTLMKGIVTTSNLGIIDKIFGSIIGAGKWCFFTCAIFWVFGKANSKFQNNYLNTSKLYNNVEPYIACMMDKITSSNENISQNNNKKIIRKPKIKSNTNNFTKKI